MRKVSRISTTTSTVRILVAGPTTKRSAAPTARSYSPSGISIAFPHVRASHSHTNVHGSEWRVASAPSTGCAPLVVRTGTTARSCAARSRRARHSELIGAMLTRGVARRAPERTAGATGSISQGAGDADSGGPAHANPETEGEPGRAMRLVRRQGSTATATPRAASGPRRTRGCQRAGQRNRARPPPNRESWLARGLVVFRLKYV